MSLTFSGLNPAPNEGPPFFNSLGLYSAGPGTCALRYTALSNIVERLLCENIPPGFEFLRLRTLFKSIGLLLAESRINALRFDSLILRGEIIAPTDFFYNYHKQKTLLSMNCV